MELERLLQFPARPVRHRRVRRSFVAVVVDGTFQNNFQYDDGGREAAGFQGRTGDCVTRAIAIATKMPYREVYDAINRINQTAKTVTLARKRRRPLSDRSKRRIARTSSRTGVLKDAWKAYLEALGWQWHPTMRIGSGCKVHLRHDELPKGRIIVQVSRHVVAVIDGVIHDTYDPSRDGTRCVYGYYTAPGVK